jgi:meiosis-specific transcription factor NDT80
VQPKVTTARHLDTIPSHPSHSMAYPILMIGLDLPCKCSLFKDSIVRLRSRVLHKHTGVPDVVSWKIMSLICIFYRNHTSSGIATAGKLQPLGSTPTSPTSGSAARENYSTSTPGLNRHLHGRQPMDISRTSYTNTVSDGHRLILSPHNSLSGQFDHSPDMYPTHQGYSPSSQTMPEGQSPPFREERTYHTIQYGHGNVVTPSISAKIEKGFFLSHDNSWTCYRRNYFSVNVSYTFKPWPNGAGGVLYLVNKGDKSASEAIQIQALALCLSATVDGANGKPIDLVQHTPKRDKGPQTIVQRTKLSPMPPPVQSNHRSSDHNSYHLNYPLGGHHRPPHQHIHLALQTAATDNCSTSPDGSSGGGSTTIPTSVTHTFERIQFKSATANNGKRRAQQQYYHLIVELWADVRTDSSQAPKWLKVSQTASDPVVVRGRSPSHYQNEGPNSGVRGHPPMSSGGRSLPPHQDWPQMGQSGAHAGYNQMPRFASNTSHNGHNGGNHYNQVHGVQPYMPMQNDMSDSMRHMSASGAAGSGASMMTSLAEDTKPAGYSYHPQALPYNMSMSREDNSVLPSHSVPMSLGRAPTDVAVDTSQGLYRYSTSEQLRGGMMPE